LWQKKGKIKNIFLLKEFSIGLELVCRGFRILIWWFFCPKNLCLDPNPDSETVWIRIRIQWIRIRNTGAGTSEHWQIIPLHLTAYLARLTTNVNVVACNSPGFNPSTPAQWNLRKKKKDEKWTNLNFFGREKWAESVEQYLLTSVARQLGGRHIWTKTTKLLEQQQKNSELQQQNSVNNSNKTLNNTKLWRTTTKLSEQQQQNSLNNNNNKTNPQNNNNKTPRPTTTKLPDQQQQNFQTNNNKTPRTTTKLPEQQQQNSLNNNNKTPWTTTTKLPEQQQQNSLNNNNKNPWTTTTPLPEQHQNSLKNNNKTQTFASSTIAYATKNLYRRKITFNFMFAREVQYAQVYYR
jgi:hypothetical protein